MSPSSSSCGPARQRVTILGSTGSIGTSTLDVLARHPDQVFMENLRPILHAKLSRI